MEIDFSSIIQKKLEQLKQDGIIEKMIQEDLEKSIRKCVDATIGGYALQEMIQNEMKNWISNDAKLLGLEAYNGLVANRAKAIVEGVLNDDLSKKITASLEEILVMRHDGIRLSEIVKKYRDFVRSDTDRDDAERYRCFCSQIDVRPDGIFTQAELRFSPASEWDADDYNSILIRIQQFREDPASIYVLKFGGVDMKKAIQLRYLNEFQRMMMNLMLNETKIIMDYDAAIRETGDASYDIWD